MLLETRLANRIRDNLAWEALRGTPPPADAPAASPWPLIRRVWAAPDDEFVRGLYVALLGREPDPAGLADRVRALRTGTPRAHLVRDVAADGSAADSEWLNEVRRLSPEGIWADLVALWTRPAIEFVRGAYDVVLRRPADPDGLAGSLGRLADGGDREEIVRVMAEGVEFCRAGTDGSWLPRLRLLTPGGLRDRLVALLGEPDEAFVRGVYDAVLHRPPDPPDLTLYLGALGRGVPRPAVLRDFLTSSEAAGRYDGPAWKAALGPLLADPTPADPTPDDLPSVDPTDPEPDRSWFAAADSAEFVRGAYRAVLGRDPTPGEVTARVRRLRFVPFYSRNRLVNALAQSWEAQVHARREAADRDRGRHTDAADRLADHLARLTDDLARVERLASAAAAAPAPADGRRGEGLLEELHRELHTSRHQLYAVLELAGRVPTGLAEQLRRIESAVASPASVAEVIERVTELQDATDALAAGQRRLRKAQPRLRYIGRKLLAGQHRILAGQQLAAADGRQQCEDLSQQVADGVQAAADAHRLLRDGHARVATRLDELQAGNRHAATRLDELQAGNQHMAARQDELRVYQQELVRGQRQTADDQGRLADHLHHLSIDQRRLADMEHASRQEVAADRFATGVWFDQLRRLGAAVAEQVGAQVPAAAPSGPPADRRNACRVCGGDLGLKWTARVLNDRYEAEYHECTACQALQVPDPVWLPEAYAREADPPLWNPDGGRFRRNYTVFWYLRALAAAGLPADRVLDYGGGYGLLTQMLADAGVDAWTHDPYVSTPFFAADRLVPRLTAVPDRSFDLITAFEVFEHLTDPLAVGAEFRRLLRPGGAVVLSTGLYEPGTHGPDWNYLSRAAGQHVLFWSRPALRAFAARFGFRSVAFLTGPAIAVTVLADATPAALGAVVRGATDRLAVAAADPATGGWLLVRGADVTTAVEPAPAGAVGGEGAACES